MQTIPIRIWSSFYQNFNCIKSSIFLYQTKNKKLVDLKWEKKLSRKFLLSKGFEIILRWMQIEKIQLHVPNLSIQGIFPT
jgi:hypothetical protein